MIGCLKKTVVCYFILFLFYFLNHQKIKLKSSNAKHGTVDALQVIFWVLNILISSSINNFFFIICPNDLDKTAPASFVPFRESLYTQTLYKLSSQLIASAS